MFLVVLGGLWLLSHFWVRSLAANLDLKREIRYGWSQVGDRLEERFTLSNTSPFPALWLELQDLSNMPGYNTSRGTGIGSNTSTEWRTDGRCMHRGVFTLGPTRLLIGDPFGIYTFVVDFPSSQNILVLPPIVPLPKIDVAPGGRTGEGRLRRTAVECTVSVAGIREYLHGDNLRRIHWPLSLHRNSLHVRVFDSSQSSDWWVILDMNQAAQTGTGDASSEEHAITLAASLVDYGIHTGKSVGFLTQGFETVWLPPRDGDKQRWSILQAMALLRPGHLALDLLLARMRRAVGQNTSLILITSDLTGRWIDEVLLAKRRGASPTVLLLDNTHLEADGDANRTTMQARLVSITIALADLGIPTYIIPQYLFAIQESTPGHLGECNLQVLPTGKVVAQHPIGIEAWRSLS